MGDFRRGSDRLDLRRLVGDDRRGPAGFSFIGTREFSATATGPLRVAVQTRKLMLYGSSDTAAATDFVVPTKRLTTLSGPDLLFQRQQQGFSRCARRLHARGALVRAV